ncbi:MAG: PEP/pyruvate-binding domain-containing protein [Calditrichia bacterium]
MNDEKSAGVLLESLTERAKELNCLYSIEEVLNETGVALGEVLQLIVKAIPPGWQYPEVTQAVIHYGGQTYQSSEFQRTPWVLKEKLLVQEQPVGDMEVYYTQQMPAADEGPFLKEERKLLRTITERLGHFLLHRQLKEIYQEWQSARSMISDKTKSEWRVILNLLRRTDQTLYLRITRKMINYLSWSGVEAAQQLLQQVGISQRDDENAYFGEINRPQTKSTVLNMFQNSEKVFDIAADNLSDQEVLAIIQKWIHEDKSAFLIRTLENQHSTLADIADAITRYHHLAPEGLELPESTRKTLNVALIRRFFTDQLEFINVAKNYVEVGDFQCLLQRMVFPSGSHGKLGGKSAGLFLAFQVVLNMAEKFEILKDIKIPRTWYITSDGLLDFLHQNNLEEVIEQKYKPIDQVRQEYPHMVQVFKNSNFSPEIVKGLSMVLDDLGDTPVIVRSSSLLEDRLGSAFSGKYKSLFLANQGSKKERLEALLDALAEVYASTFSPDPIEYRAERNLLDFHEEMGIMIQEVVGQRVGNYYFPSFAGVAFSNNEFRWSPRIKREDGLIRLVPGLGTRAVDRLSDDYPILVAPGQPTLRVNVTPDEIMRYSPHKLDVINLKTNSFETVEFRDLLAENGAGYPLIKRLVSISKDQMISKPSFMDLDFKGNLDEIVITANGLISDTSFVDQMNKLLEVLQDRMGFPVDIEFAHDGKHFYLLQCRPQSYSRETKAMPIPKDIPENRIIFSANRYISNGRTPDVTHIVYVDPQKYTQLEKLEDLREVGRAVGKLNKILPKRQFILMGPGRWGSRGDIKLGVNVTYSEINNTAVLIEIARKQGNYLPDLSFGTHFFQDLVEASIRYLPLYPDDEGILFNEHFLLKSPNMLSDVLPEYARLSEVLRVIDVPKSTDEQVLRVLMNAELDEALGYLASPSSAADIPVENDLQKQLSQPDYWRWRMRMARRIAADLDPARFGVKGFYIFGSVKNATAGPGSDIDVLLHFEGNDQQQKELAHWLEGWSLCLAQMNYLRTGYKSHGLLDVHWISNEDIKKKTSFALKIDAVTDAARPLPMKNGRGEQG